MGVSVPFRVIDRPYVAWTTNPVKENIDFLNSIDCDFYFRSVQNIFFGTDETLRFDIENYEQRKDVSSLARLIWNHGLETLTTLLGAYVQAPHAVFGFFLKCQNADCRKIANYLLTGCIPQDHCLTRSEFDFEDFVRGIHCRAPFASDATSIENISRTIKDFLCEYDQDDHRAEYNSIKHGLRARHGRSALAFGLEKIPGVEPPEEDMTMLFDSVDGSHFLSAGVVPNLTKKASREQFSLRTNSVAWSLEKTLEDIQLISVLIRNIVSALKIAAGIPASQTYFCLPTSDQWETYLAHQHRSVGNVSFEQIVEIPNRIVDAEKSVAEFYRERQRKRQKAQMSNSRQ